MTTANIPTNSKRRAQLVRNDCREKAGLFLRLVVVIASVGAFLFSQLPLVQGGQSQTPDILVFKQVDADEVKLKDEGKNQSHIGLISAFLLLPSFDEQLPLVAGQLSFPFERLLCFSSRGPPKG